MWKKSEPRRATTWNTTPNSIQEEQMLLMVVGTSILFSCFSFANGGNLYSYKKTGFLAMNITENPETGRLYFGMERPVQRVTQSSWRGWFTSKFTFKECEEACRERGASVRVFGRFYLFGALLLPSSLSLSRTHFAIIETHHLASLHSELAREWFPWRISRKIDI